MIKTIAKYLTIGYITFSMTGCAPLKDSNASNLKFRQDTSIYPENKHKSGQSNNPRKDSPRRKLIFGQETPIYEKKYNRKQREAYHPKNLEHKLE